MLPSCQQVRARPHLHARWDRTTGHSIPGMFPFLGAPWGLHHDRAGLPLHRLWEPRTDGTQQSEGKRAVVAFVVDGVDAGDARSRG